MLVGLVPAELLVLSVLLVRGVIVAVVTVIPRRFSSCQILTLFVSICTAV